MQHVVNNVHLFLPSELREKYIQPCKVKRYKVCFRWPCLSQIAFNKLNLFPAQNIFAGRAKVLVENSVDYGIKATV